LHMLNHVQSPDVCRFLSDLARDATPQLSGFDWGIAASSRFLPRVEVGRIVLRTAEWRLGRSDLDGGAPSRAPSSFADDLLAWRELWNVPRKVYLAAADNRLMLDLGEPSHREEFRRELVKLSGDADLILQEVLPDFSECWVAGPEGRYMVELIVPLLAR